MADQKSRSKRLQRNIKDGGIYHFREWKETSVPQEGVDPPKGTYPKSLTGFDTVVEENKFSYPYSAYCGKSGAMET